RDGRYLAGVSADRTAWVAEAATGKILHYLCRDSNAYGGTNDRRNRIVGMCLHPDSRRAFVLWGYDRMQIFDLETGKEIRSYSVASPLVRGWKWTMCFSPDGGTLYLGTTAGAVCSLDAESGGYLSVTDTPSGTNIGCVKVSDSGERLWCCSTEGTFFLFRTDDMDEYEERTPPQPLWDPFWVSEDGSRILGIGDNSEPWLWDPDTEEEVRSFRSLGSSSSIDAADDLSMVVLGNDGKAIQFWDGRAEQKRAPWEVSRTKDWQEQQEQRKDTDRLKEEIESRIRENRIREAVLLLENAEERYDPTAFLDQRRKLTRVCKPGNITETHVITRFEAKWGKFLTTHPRKDVFAVYAYTDCPTVFLYSEKGILLFTVPLPKETEIIYSLRFLPTGILAAGCKNCAVLIDPDRGEILRVLGDPQNDRFSGFGEPLFTPDSRMMLAAGKDRKGDETWELWNVENCRVLRTLEMPPEGWASWHDSAFRFLDGGKKLISSTRFCDGMPIRDLETGKVVQQLETYGRSARIMGITPDGSRLFVRYSPERPVSVIDMETGEICGEIAGSGGVHMDELCISPDGTLMAAYYDKTLHIWTVPDIRLQCEIPDNAQDNAVKLAFFRDSSLLGIRLYDRIRVMAIRRELR
nr:WD40 repeat domain-containing protein [Clostridiales bacterium]